MFARSLFPGSSPAGESHERRVPRVALPCQLASPPSSPFYPAPPRAPLLHATLRRSADYQSEYYGPGGNYDFFPQGPPSSQAQTPVDLPFVPSSGPSGTPLGGLEHPLPGHHPSSEAQRFTDILAHPPGDSPSPEPSLPGPLHSMSAEVFGPSPPFSSLSVNGGASYGNHLSHPPEINEAAVW